jgi:hypothetical protein
MVVPRTIHAPGPCRPTPPPHSPPTSIAAAPPEECPTRQRDAPATTERSSGSCKNSSSRRLGAARRVESSKQENLCVQCLGVAVRAPGDAGAAGQIVR